MTIPHWFLVAGFAILLVQSVRLLRKAIEGWRKAEPAVAKGRPVRGAFYALTGAMMPWKKESARLHPASYLLGVAYHFGIFLGFVWVALLFFNVEVQQSLVSASVLLLAFAGACGLGLFVKRIVSANLRHFSSPDDYFSNVLVTGWQAMIVLALLSESMMPRLFLLTGVLLLYIPLGKLKHAIYFVPARVYLGLFYGRRGVWPAAGRRSWKAE
jgi:hypothetical protein